MNFQRKFFDPMTVGGTAAPDQSVTYVAGPQLANVYVYGPKTILALNVALAARRPLLVSGEPGSGKSSLARSAAAVLGWTYYERVITSRTQAADLMWSFDALRRLSDATVGTERRALPPPEAYIEPGPLWWAFDLGGAARSRGGRAVTDPGAAPPKWRGNQAVLLLDEIDKADPDVPNDLLEPFEAKSFTVRETGERVTATRDVLLVLTTNGERELPPAFLRRCVVLAIEPPNGDWHSWFVRVAERKLGPDAGTLYDDVAVQIMRLRKAAEAAGHRPPGTGEFLDALEACRQLGVTKQLPDVFEAVTLATLWKQKDAPVSASTAGPVA
jgi:MoxR-like ATPase